MVSLCLPALCPQLEVGIATHIQKLIGIKESVLPEDVSNGLVCCPSPLGHLCILGCEKSLGRQELKVLKMPDQSLNLDPGVMSPWASVSSLDARRGRLGHAAGSPRTDGCCRLTSGGSAQFCSPGNTWVWDHILPKAYHLCQPIYASQLNPSPSCVKGRVYHCASDWGRVIH